MAIYNVQCLAGHVFDAPLESDLERRCENREKNGFLDALTVTALECPECSERRAEDDAILADVAAIDAYRFDTKHPNAINRYLEGDCLD